MKKVFLAILLSMCTILSHASPPLTGKVTEIWVNDNSTTNIAFISIGENFSTLCNSNETRYLILDLSEASMKEAYSMALAAYMADKSVTIAGNGNCYGQSEKLKYINMIK